MLTIPFFYIDLCQTGNFIENVNSSLKAFEKCISNLEKDNGLAIKEYLFENAKIDGKFSIDLEHSYGELWIQDINCHIVCCLVIKIIVDSKDISKNELLELTIINGEPEYIGLVALV